MVNDGGASSSIASGAGSLSAAAPQSPAESLVYRVGADGTYQARVGWSSGVPGDYLLSIARDCRAGWQADGDGDGVPDGSDCAPTDPGAWAVPGEATDLLFHGGAAPGALGWNAPASPGGTSVLYDLLRSARADDFGTPTCVAPGITVTSASDPAVPATVFYYLVRARNACGGALGSRSDGTPRFAGACP
jgi:hypothetical protein